MSTNRPEHRTATSTETTSREPYVHRPEHLSEPTAGFQHPCAAHPCQSAGTECRPHRPDPAGAGICPLAPCCPPTSRDATIAEAIAAVADADAIVVATPVYQAAYSGLLKVFLDLLPQFAFRGKAVLPIVTGGSPAHVLAVDYALRPVLANLGAAHIGQGWFVPSSHIRQWPDGGVLIDPASLAPIAQVTDEFLAILGQRHAAAAVPTRVDLPGGGQGVAGGRQSGPAGPSSRGR